MSPRPVTASEADVGRMANQLRVVLGRLVRRLRAEHRFPLMHASVLGRLDREGPLSTVDLANAERVRPQSMGQTLAELEAQGLIERRPDPEDGRRTLLELTQPGREVLTEERRRRDGWMARAIEAELDEQERRTLGQAVELLERLSRV
jgi:DNA-binding MarR family transcriptional regulator